MSFRPHLHFWASHDVSLDCTVGQCTVNGRPSLGPDICCLHRETKKIVRYPQRLINPQVISDGLRGYTSWDSFWCKEAAVLLQALSRCLCLIQSECMSEITSDSLSTFAWVFPAPPEICPLNNVQMSPCEDAAEGFTSSESRWVCWWHLTFPTLYRCKQFKGTKNKKKTNILRWKNCAIHMEDHHQDVIRAFGDADVDVL